MYDQFPVRDTHQNQLRQDFQQISFNANIQKQKQLQIEMLKIKKELDQKVDQLKNVNYEQQILQKKLSEIKQEVIRLERQKFDGISGDQITKIVQEEIAQQKRQNTQKLENINVLKQSINSLNLKMLKIGNEKLSIQQQISDQNHNLNMIQVEIASYQSKIHNISTKIKDYEREVVKVKQEEKMEELDKIQLDKQVQRLQNKKNNLHDQVIQRQDQLEVEFSMIDDSKNLLQDNLNNRNKLISAKLMYNVFFINQQNILQEAFSQTQNYSYFDRNFSDKLKSFMIITGNLTAFRKKQGLLQWYNNAFRPLQQIQLNENISLKISQTRMKMLCFNAIKKSIKRKVQIYKTKTDGVQQIWQRLQVNRKSELKRAFQIWKETKQNEDFKIRYVQNLFSKHYKRILRERMNRWIEEINQVELKCRVVLLHKECLQKIFLTSVFSAFKQEIINSRRIKTLRMSIYFIAWKKIIDKKKQLFYLNYGCKKFNQKYKIYIQQVCFNALKSNQKKQSLKTINNALQNDMDVVLDQNAVQTQQLQQKVSNKQYKKSCTTFKNMLSAYIYSYFKKWKDFKVYKDVRINIKFKEQIIKMYRDQILYGFLKFKNHAHKVKIKRKRLEIQYIQEEFSQNENDSIVKEQKKQAVHTEVRSVASSKYSKIFKKFQNIILQKGLYRWKRYVNKLNDAGQSYALVLDKQRKRYLRDSWAIYKEFYLKCLQHDRNLVTCKISLDKFNLRKMRNMYSAICYSVNLQKQVKKYLKRIFLKLDIKTKKKIIYTWIKNGEIKRIYELGQKQTSIVSSLDEKSRMIGSQDFSLQNYDKQICELQNQAQKKAYMMLANYLVRVNIKNFKERFKYWKQEASLHFQRLKLLSRQITHKRKYQFMLFKNAIRTFVKNQKYTFLLDRKSQVIKEQQEIETYINYGDEQLEQKKKKTEILTGDQIDKQEFQRQNISKVVNILEKKNKQKVFISRKRKIFQGWWKAVLQQKAFLLCIENAITKSLLLNGFVNIQDRFREIKKNKKIYQLCSKFFSFFKRNNLKEFFDTWKSYNQKKVLHDFQEASGDKNQTDQFYSNKIDNIKNQNSKNVNLFIQKRLVLKLWRYWTIRNYINDVFNIKQNQSVQVLAASRQKRAVQKWFFRSKLTIKTRKNFACMKQNKIFRLKILVWQILIQRRDIVNSLVSGLSNLEKFMRSKIQYDTMKTIKSFKISKNLAQGVNQKRAFLDFISIVNQFHLKRQQKYFGRFKGILKTKLNRTADFNSIVLKIRIANLRDGFNHWRKFMERQVFIQEMNQVGPITEHVFEAQRLMSNLTDYLKNEHFTDEQIIYIKNNLVEHNKHIMMKAVLRFKIKKEDKCVIKCMEHWKMWIKIKKLFKYHLEKANNQVDFGKCDMSWAFKKWRRSEFETKNVLDRMTWKKLCTLNIKQSYILESCARSEAINNTAITHLQLQRDELVEHKVRSQKLALQALTDYQRRAMRKALSRWLSSSQNMWEEDAKADIEKKLDDYGILKQKQFQIEEQNRKLQLENEELSSFSQEGFIVAKNAVTLSDQVEEQRAEVDSLEIRIEDLLEKNRFLKEQLNKLEYDHNQFVGRKQGVTIHGTPSLKLLSNKK